MPFIHDTRRHTRNPGIAVCPSGALRISVYTVCNGPLMKRSTGTLLFPTSGPAIAELSNGPSQVPAQGSHVCHHVCAYVREMETDNQKVCGQLVFSHCKTDILNQCGP